ncbi:hypothetical protein ACHAPX_000323 [Trichoderma viride]
MHSPHHIVCGLITGLLGLLIITQPALTVSASGNKLDIDLNPIFTIDTTKAARYPHQAFYDYTLKKLLQDFGIPFTNKQLHVAGNDAHFTLRVLLMIAVADVRRELDQVPIWVPVFEAIARAPLPPKPLKHAEKAAVIKRNGLAATEQEKMALSNGSDRL